MKIYNRIVFTLFLLFLTQPAFAGDRVPVFVSIIPQKYFVQQIGGDRVDVRVMVQPGASPATYEPKPRQMAELSKAKIYFAIGVPFENAWLKKIAAANPKMTVIHTDQGIKKIPMMGHHQDDKAEKHPVNLHRKHDGLDPHIWLSPPLVKIQIRAILTALKKMDPSHQAVYEANYNRFVTEIDELDIQFKKTFTGKQRLQFLVFHPAWGYFANSYGIEQIPIEVEGKDPKPFQLKRLIRHAREKGIKMVFVQPHFSTESAKVIAKEIDGQVSFADPLAEDWKVNLSKVAERFKAALK